MQLLNLNSLSAKLHDTNRCDNISIITKNVMSLKNDFSYKSGFENSDLYLKMFSNPDELINCYKEEMTYFC